MELARVWPAALLPEWQCDATGFGKRGQIVQGPGGVGGNVEEDQIGGAQYVVSSRKCARVVFGGALPFHGVKESGYAARLIAA